MPPVAVTAEGLIEIIDGFVPTMPEGHAKLLLQMCRARLAEDDAETLKMARWIERVRAAVELADENWDDLSDEPTASPSPS